MSFSQYSDSNICLSLMEMKELLDFFMLLIRKDRLFNRNDTFLSPCTLHDAAINIQSDDSCSFLRVPVMFSCQLLCLATGMSYMTSWVRWGGGSVISANILSRSTQLVLCKKLRVSKYTLSRCTFLYSSLSIIICFRKI